MAEILGPVRASRKNGGPIGGSKNMAEIFEGFKGEPTTTQTLSRGGGFMVKKNEKQLQLKNSKNGHTTHFILQTCNFTFLK